MQQVKISFILTQQPILKELAKLLIVPEVGEFCCDEHQQVELTTRILREFWKPDSIVSNIEFKFSEAQQNVEENKLGTVSSE